MKTLVLVALFGIGCEHDPRYEHKQDKRPEPVEMSKPAAEPEQPLVERTIERPVTPSPKLVPLKKRIRHHKP
ncbi:MAG: hypothetical protein QM831_21035 [Kofleriaceae bacterium]